MYIPFSERKVYCRYCTELIELIVTDHYNKSNPDAIAGVFRCERCYTITIFDHGIGMMHECSSEHIEILKSVMFPKFKNKFVFKKRKNGRR